MKGLFNKKSKTLGTAMLNLSKFCTENTKQTIMLNPTGFCDRKPQTLERIMFNLTKCFSKECKTLQTKQLTMSEHCSKGLKTSSKTILNVT